MLKINKANNKTRPNKRNIQLTKHENTNNDIQLKISSFFYS